MQSIIMFWTEEAKSFRLIPYTIERFRGLFLMNLIILVKVDAVEEDVETYMFTVKNILIFGNFA